MSFLGLGKNSPVMNVLQNWRESIIRDANNAPTKKPRNGWFNDESHQMSYGNDLGKIGVYGGEIGTSTTVLIDDETSTCNIDKY